MDGPTGGRSPGGSGVGHRWLLVDAGVLVAVAGSLAAVHVLLPEATAEGFALDYADPDPLALWASAFVHASDGHLLENLLGGFCSGGVAYLLCLQADRRRWFHRTLVAFLTVLPVVVSLASLATFAHLGVTPPPGRGFSGVTAGFGGFALTALLVWLRQFYDRAAVASVLLLVAVALGLELFWIYDVGLAGPPLVAFGLGVVVAFVGVRDEVFWRIDHVAQLGYAALVVVFLGVFVHGLFPSTVVQDGAVVNVVGHAVGFVGGAVVGYLTLW